MKRFVVLVVVLLAAVVVWRVRRTHAVNNKPAHVTISWQGHRRGTMALPAEVRWCPVTRTGIIEGLSGDSGILVALRVPNVLTSGAYAIVSPEATGLAAPYATASFRWMYQGRDSSLEQFRSQSGSVQLQVAGTLVSGRFNAHMRAPAGMPVTDTLVVDASFQRLPVVTTAAGCS